MMKMSAVSCAIRASATLARQQLKSPDRPSALVASWLPAAQRTTNRSIRKHQPRDAELIGDLQVRVVGYAWDVHDHVRPRDRIRPGRRIAVRADLEVARRRRRRPGCPRTSSSPTFQRSVRPERCCCSGAAPPPRAPARTDRTESDRHDQRRPGPRGRATRPPNSTAAHEHRPERHEPSARAGVDEADAMITAPTTASDLLAEPRGRVAISPSRASCAAASSAASPSGSPIAPARRAPPD